MMVQLTACTRYPGRVFSFPIDDLDSNLTGIPGIKDAYVSGYAQPTMLTPSVSGFGGLVIESEDRGTGKGYVWEFVMDGSNQVWYQGLEKPYPGHHFDPGSGIDLNRLFGNL